MAGLALDWFKGIPPEKKKPFEETVRNSTIALNQLYVILQDRERELVAQESKIDDFDTPNWSEKQAFRNGKRAAIRQVIDLLGFLKGD